MSTILGEPAKQSANPSTFSASDFLDFLEQKVESVRSDTAGSAPPSFSSTTCNIYLILIVFTGIGAEGDWRSGFKELWTGPSTDFPYQRVSGNPASIPHKDVQRLSPGRSFAVVPDNCHCGHRHWRNQVWIQAIWRIIARFRTSPSCRRSWRESLFVNYRSTSLQTAYFLNFNPDLEGIIPQSQLYSGYCPTFSPQLTRGRFRFWPCSTLVPHLTLDHSILLGPAIHFMRNIGVLRSDWMQSFIVGRTLTVHYGGSVSRCAQLRSGIAQGSVLGPILYVLYTADVQKLVESFGFRVHLYADDT